jgi:hypothetical protein
VSVVLPWLLLTALFVHAAAHVAIAVTLAREGAWDRAVAAFLLPPLAPVWGWRAGRRLFVYAWTSALAVYAIGVSLA